MGFDKSKLCCTLLGMSSFDDTAYFMEGNCESELHTLMSWFDVYMGLSFSSKKSVNMSTGFP